MLDKSQIKELLDARDVISVSLGSPMSKDHESSIWPCPFHNEKSPGAFHVFKDGYKCFSCGTWGDIFSWRETMHGESFVEALEALARQAGLDVEKELASPEQNRQNQAEILEIKRRNAERVALELEEKIKVAQEVLAELRKSARWLDYHDNLTAETRRIWSKRLALSKDQETADAWIAIWQLGYVPSFRLWYRDIQQEYNSPTLTIPIWDEGWNCNGIKHRILNPMPGHLGDKYRPDVTGLPAAPFYAQPDLHDGTLLLVEGEIKAMVSYIALDDPKLQVVGLPGKVPDAAIFDRFESYGSIFLLMDPDAFDRPSPGKPSGVERAIFMLGADRVGVIQLAMKVDDAIAAGCVDKCGLKRILRAARPASKYLREKGD